MTNEVTGYKYKVIKSNASSRKLGNCEVCGKFVDDVYHQIESKKYIGLDSETGWTHYKCSDYFGHKGCLESKQR